MAVDRKIDTLEGALRDAIERFGSEKVAEAIGKSKDYVNNLSNPNQKNIGERRRKKISHEDSIILDKFCLENEMAPPMIAVHQMLIDNYRSNLENYGTYSRKHTLCYDCNRSFSFSLCQITLY